MIHQRTNFFTAIFLAALAAPFVRADEPTTAASKSQYDLLHPVPADQLREMDTDRPNVTNTPHTVDAGHLQIEAGALDYAYHRQHVGGIVEREDDFGFGLLNFRVGVLNNLEVNATIDAYETDRLRNSPPGSTTTARGFGDTTLGAKLNLWGNDGGDDVWASGLAIQPQFKIATAPSDLGNGHFECSIAVPFVVNLPAGFHLGAQPVLSLERNSSNTGYVTGVQGSVSIDHEVLGKLDVYLEYAAEGTTEKHTQAVETIDVGGVYPLTDNLDVDVGVNFGLNKASNNVEVVTGISLRF